MKRVMGSVSGTTISIIDEASVTILKTKNSDIQPYNSDLGNSEAANPVLKIKETKETKVQVKPPKRRQRNVVLLQFSSSPRIDEPTLSCVWEGNSTQTDLKKKHDKCEQEEDSKIRTSKVSSLPVNPLKVLSSKETSRCNNSTSRTATAIHSFVDPHQVLHQPKVSVDNNFTIKTSEGNCPSLDLFQVSLHSTTLANFESTNCTITTRKSCEPLATDSRRYYFHNPYSDSLPEVVFVWS